MKIGRLVLLIPSLLLGSRADAAQYSVRWVLAHDPSVAAEKSARDFAVRIEKETAGDVRVEVVKSAAYEKNAGKRMSPRALMRDVAQGRVEMTQMYTDVLAHLNVKLRTLGAPYLFRDYEHAEAVFEGPLGAELIAAVPPASGLRALGVTYSGGYGIFATKDRIARAPSDMQGAKLHTVRFPWAARYMQALGVEPVVAPAEAFVPLAREGFADAVETTVARFDEYGYDRGARVVVNTDHFLLTTMIVVNEAFYQSLPARHQAALRRVALDSAREERSLSVRANQEGRKRLERRGVTFVDLAPAEKKLFMDALQPASLEPGGEPEWAASIRATPSARTAAR